MRERKALTLPDAAALAIILAGVGLRLWLYAMSRSLWYDEAKLALNLAERSFFGLTRPLVYDQGAPILFLLAEKSLMTALGASDYVLRLLPFLAGLASLPLMWRVARTLLGDGAGLVALALFAVADRPVYYASELKQYSCDTAAALLLMAAALAYLRAGERRRGPFVWLLVLGFLGTWLSFPLLFMLCGVGAALGLDAAVRRDAAAARRLAWLAAAWGGSLLVNYIVLLRPLSGNTELIQFWQRDFMPLPPWRQPGWFAVAWRRLLADPAGLAYADDPAGAVHRAMARVLWPTATVLIAAGAVSLLRRNWRTALLVLVPFPAVLAASGMQRYPFGGRLLLFAAPLLYVLAAAGVAWAGQALGSLACGTRRRNQPSAPPRAANDGASGLAAPRCAGAGRKCQLAVAAVLSALLLYRPITDSAARAANPFSEHVKPLLAYLAKNRRANETIYVSYGAVWAFVYYAPHYGLNRGKVVVGPLSGQDAEPYLRRMDELKGERVWLLFSHRFTWATVDEEATDVPRLNAIGSCVRHLTAPGAGLYLYDL